METNEYREQRLASMRALKEMGYEPYGCKYGHIDLKVARETFEEGKPVRVAGRLLMIRRMGKMNFCTMNDGTGRFQLIFKRDELSAQVSPVSPSEFSWECKCKQGFWAFELQESLNICW